MGDNVPATAPLKSGGNCFEAALSAFDRMRRRGQQDVRLIHAVICGTGDAEGYQFAHAWVEYDAAFEHGALGGTLRMAFDDSNGRTVHVPAALFGLLARTLMRREYDVRAVRRMMRLYETYGPWDDEMLAHDAHDGATYLPLPPHLATANSLMGCLLL